MDWVARLRGLARLDWPVEVQLFVSTLSEDELDRLRGLLQRGGGEAVWAEVRACLDAVHGVRS
jgi:hypothetical protein